VDGYPESYKAKNRRKSCMQPPASVISPVLLDDLVWSLSVQYLATAQHILTLSASILGP
jgi:hypothetical protein